MGHRHGLENGQPVRPALAGARSPTRCRRAPPGVAIETVRASDPAKVDTLAFEFLVLTAARGGEVRGAVWSEMDRDENVWTVPANRMKTGREHRVPLCGRAVAILGAAPELGDGESPIVFVTERGKPLDGKRMCRLLEKHRIAAVPHGFRSSFRDWAAEETDHPISTMVLHCRNFNVYSEL